MDNWANHASDRLDILARSNRYRQPYLFAVAPATTYLRCNLDRYRGVRRPCFRVLYGVPCRFRITGPTCCRATEWELLATQELLEQSSRVTERTYVARELHDTLGHHLVALKVQLELAHHLATEGKAKVPLDDAIALVKELLNDVREVVSEVKKPAIIDLCKAIETLLAGIKNLSIHLTFPVELKIGEPAYAHLLFRCVQETVTNTLKHANAKNLWVEFKEDQQSTTLTVRDDGKGCSLLHPGHGLNGMRERLEAHNGRLEIINDSPPRFYA